VQNQRIDVLQDDPHWQNTQANQIREADAVAATGFVTMDRRGLPLDRDMRLTWGRRIEGWTRILK
jgi:hypothetical protein